MGSNIAITKEIENYINNYSLELTEVQKEIISYNNSLGDIKRMQISISQCHFLHLIVKIANIKKNFRDRHFYRFKQFNNVIIFT